MIFFPVSKLFHLTSTRHSVCKKSSEILSLTSKMSTMTRSRNAKPGSRARDKKDPDQESRSSSRDQRNDKGEFEKTGRKSTRKENEEQTDERSGSSDRRYDRNY